MKVACTVPAKRDLREIGQWIARDNPAAALAIVQRIRQAAASLSRHPRAGRPGRHPDERELVVSGTPYIIPYRVQRERVELLAVFHGARRWPDQFDER